MSLMKALSKIAIGVALAKGATALSQRNQRGGTGQSGSLGGLLGGLSGGSTGQSGGVQGMLGNLLGGGASGGRGGLGGLLDNLGGSGSQGISRGGLGSAAGAGGLLAGLGNTMNKAPAHNTKSFGAVLNSQFDETPEPEIQPSQDQEAIAALMLTAMIQAAKSDGEFDEAEKEKLLGHLGEVDEEEAAFIKERVRAPIDIEALVANTPEGMARQVYAISLLAIELDTRDEAEYLHKLAAAYGLSPQEVNAVHAEVGAPSLYT
jgi:uncharacterized membrane protein YebE (DUF533 family)